ncbi:MAG: hypothetical protein KAH57_07775 [Thermoplasmata archaeon]|nr:hypothetical protein [Thermoplasmata archaeon]
MDYQRERMDWYVRDGSETVGPMDWWDLEVGVRSGEISNKGHLQNDVDGEWIPIKEYFSRLDREKGDAFGGLMPNGKDVIFLLGVFTFFIGVGSLFLNNFLGYGILMISLAMEFGSVYFSHRNDPGSATKNVGNVIALLWAGFQGLITAGIIIFTLA